MENRYVYLDNAATSFPKPESVYEAVNLAMREEGGNPGRSGHRYSAAAGKAVGEARNLCARLFSAESAANIIFTNNATSAINLALYGFLNPGDHVITSDMEHNSVTRPLRDLEGNGVAFTKLRTDICCGLNAGEIKKAVRANTRLVVCSHITNVTGTVSDISSIGAFCAENGLAFLVDAAQSAGTRHICVKNIDMLAFTGHKGLLGPQGTGGLYVRTGIRLKHIVRGGTGTLSESLDQPDAMPAGYESGTVNAPGIAGLGAGVRFILERGENAIRKRETELTNKLIEGISAMDGLRLVGPGAGQNRGSAVSVCFDRLSPSEAANILDSSFNIAVRGGLQCNADAHASLGTLADGGVLRISPNYFNTEEDIDHCLMALDACAGGF